MFALAQSTMSAGVPRHKILPLSRGWLSENILAARLGEDFSLDIPFHRTGFTSADAILPKGHSCLDMLMMKIKSDCRMLTVHLSRARNKQGQCETWSLVSNFTRRAL
jgi:hypothetical protein